MTFQEYLETITTSQCHQLLVEAYSHMGGISLARALLKESGNDPDPQSNLPWCICARCRSMPLPEENVCCRSNPCITTTESFETIVVNRDILSVAIVHRSDVYSEDPEYAPTDYRKAAYRQWTMWRCGYLGRRNRKVVPSCVVWAVRSKYPAPDGCYLGFKEY